MRVFIYCAIACCFCTHLLSKQGDYNEVLLDEIRIELGDLKHAMHTYQVDIQILEEKLRKQEQMIALLKSAQQVKPPSNTDHIERKISLLEKNQEKTDISLIQYKEKIHEFEQEISQQNQRLDEVAKLKSTLTSISKAMNGTKTTAATAAAPAKTYKVKSGDSLERIARNHKTTVENLKKLNQLDSDKISIGQTLKIAHED